MEKSESIAVWNKLHEPFHRLSAVVEALKTGQPLLVGRELKALAKKVAANPLTFRSEEEKLQWASKLATEMASCND
jgi:hypothetical protein